MHVCMWHIYMDVISLSLSLSLSPSLSLSIYLPLSLSLSLSSSSLSLSLSSSLSLSLSLSSLSLSLSLSEKIRFTVLTGKAIGQNVRLLGCVCKNVKTVIICCQGCCSTCSTYKKMQVGMITNYKSDVIVPSFLNTTQKLYLYLYRLILFIK